MKALSVSLALAALVSGSAFADAKTIEGSDTLFGVISDAIVQGGLDGQVSYVGGGSGKGEAALVEGRQGIAPMSRAAKDDAIAKAKASGISLTGHKIGLDGVAVWVNKANASTKIDLNSLRSIYTCKAGDWKDVPGSGKTGAIKVFRRNDESGTTDTFKNLVKIDAFGPCVTVLPETADIAAVTSRDENALGFSGLSAGTDKNKALAIAVDASSTPFLPTVQNIRSFKYPLSRYLYVYEAGGSTRLASQESALLAKLLDRSFLDPILQANEFFTLD